MNARKHPTGAHGADAILDQRSPRRPGRNQLRAAPDAPAPTRHAPEIKRVLTKTGTRRDFNAKETLRRTGFRLSDEARQAGRDTKRAATRISQGVPSTPVPASSGAGFDVIGGGGDLLLYGIYGLLGLILLDVILGNRASSLIGDIQSWVGSSVGRVVSPTDPLVQFSTANAPGQPPAASGGASTTTGTVTSSPTSPSSSSARFTVGPNGHIIATG